MKKIVSLFLALALLLGMTGSLATASAEETRLVRIVQPGTLPADYETGIAAVNEKLKADGLDLEVQIIRIPWDVYAEKLNLMLVNGDEFEILHIMQDVKNLSSIAGMEAVIPLDEYLGEYPELVAQFTDTDWASTVFNGQHYAVPDAWTSFDKTMAYINVRTDVMKKVGYEEFPANDVDALIDLMKKSQDYMLDETGLKAYSWLHQVQDTAHWLHRTYDSYPFYVENSLGLVMAMQDGTVKSFYESEEFKKDCEVYAKMYAEGLIDPDLLNKDSQAKYASAHMGAFLPSQTFDPGESATIMRSTDLKDVEVNWYRMNPEKPDMIYTFGQNMNAVSSTAADPKAALDFLQWLYSSKENHDLFHYGVEGVHYTATDDMHMDQVLGEDGNPIYQLDTWMTGYLPYLRYTSDTPDVAIDYAVYRSNNYVVSPIAGFVFDATDVTTEVTNLQAEIIASIYPIKFGMISYEDNIDAAIQRLKAAGLDTYLEEYTKQLNAYLEANPDVLETAAQVIVK